jgi:hypothetical protein
MLICSTFHEQSPSLMDASLETARRGGERSSAGRVPAGTGQGPQVVDVYAKAFPGKKPIEI